MIAIVSLLALAALQTSPSSDVLRTAVETLTTASTNEARYEAVVTLLRNRGIPFTTERFTIEKAIGREPRTEGRNIVVSFGAAGAGPRIVVGAHYDAVRLQDGTLSHGAVDNAGSSIVLLQIAELLKAKPPDGRSVTLVWFDMEELGLIGSGKYAEAHRGDGITGMVNLDINAYGDTVIFGASKAGENAALRRAVLETCAVKDAPCVGLPQMPSGDDRSFTKAGVPAISLAMVSAIEAHQVWLIVNAGADAGLAPGVVPSVLKTIHTPNDTIDKVNGEAMARAADFVVNVVRLLAR